MEGGNLNFMRHTAFALVLGSLLVANLPAADQQLVNMVMPDAKVVAGINVDSARNSPFGSFLLRQASENNAELQKFIQASGFNPQTDLNEILIATAGAPAKPAEPVAPAAPAAPGAPAAPAAPGAHLATRGRAPEMKGLILARGTFNIDKISALARTEGKQNIEQYNGVLLISDPKHALASAMAFVNANIAIAGDLADVKAAIDRRSRANSMDPQLTTKMNSLSNSQDAWAVSIAPMSSLNAGPASDPALQGALGGDLFKKITQTSGGIKFGAQIELSTEMVALDEKNATALSDVVKFLVGMVTMNAGPAKGAPPAMMTLLQGMNVQTQGNVVNVSVSVPEDQMESLVNSMHPAVKNSGAKI